jgi:hypothetical protein
MNLSSVVTDEDAALADRLVVVGLALRRARMAVAVGAGGLALGHSAPPRMITWAASTSSPTTTDASSSRVIRPRRSARW